MWTNMCCLKGVTHFEIWDSFWKVGLILKCGTHFESWDSFWSVGLILKGGTHFEMWHSFWKLGLILKCGTHFERWDSFWNVGLILKCGTHFEMWGSFWNMGLILKGETHSLCAFAKSPKATISFVTCICTSVWTTQPQLDGIYKICYSRVFRKFVNNIQFWDKFNPTSQNLTPLHNEYLYVAMIISRPFLLRMRKCTEKKLQKVNTLILR